MEWLNNLGIKLKLVLSYIILCVLMLFIGLAGINGLRIMDIEIKDLYHNSMRRVSYIREAATNLGHTRFIQALTTDPGNKDRLAELNAQAGEISGRIAAAIGAYGEAVTEAEDRVMFQELQRLIGIGRQARIDFMEMVVQREDYEAAREVFYARLVPANDAIIIFPDFLIRTASSISPPSR